MCHMALPSLCAQFTFLRRAKRQRASNEGQKYSVELRLNLIQLIQNRQKNKAKSGDHACITCISFVV
nr:MAG TPA: hypothetical protein [Caudoviricetes sp.]